MRMDRRAPVNLRGAEKRKISLPHRAGKTNETRHSHAQISIAHAARHFIPPFQPQFSPPPCPSPD